MIADPRLRPTGPWAGLDDSAHLELMAACCGLSRREALEDGQAVARDTDPR